MEYISVLVIETLMDTLVVKCNKIVNDKTDHNWVTLILHRSFSVDVCM